MNQMTEKEKDKRLSLVVKSINKRYKAEVITKGITITKEWFSTGIADLDHALSGGFIRGGFIELYGEESSGKSTTALFVVAEAQKRNFTAAYLDVEDAYDDSWAKKVGVNTNDLLVMDKTKIEEATKETICAESVLQLMTDLIETKGVDIIILDSIACLTPKEEFTKSFHDNPKLGSVARLMSRALCKMNSLNKRFSSIIFINQTRDKIGGAPRPGMVLKDTPGGRAIKFYAFQRLHVVGYKEMVDDIPHRRINIKLIKSKVSKPDQTSTFLMNPDGIVDKIDSLFNLAKRLKFFGDNIILKGANYYLGESKIASSADEFKKYIKENPDFYSALYKKLIEWEAPTENKPITIELPDEDSIEEAIEKEETESTQKE